MDELIARVSASAGITTEQAEKAIGLVFAFLKREAPGEVDDMLNELPGGQEAAAQGAVQDDAKPKAGGLMGGLMSALGGGGLMGLAAQLTGLGLGTGEMASVGKEIFAYARETAGDEKVGQVAAAIPGLGQFI